MAGDGDRTLKHKGSGYEGGPLERLEMAIARRGTSGAGDGDRTLESTLESYI